MYVCRSKFQFNYLKMNFHGTFCTSIWRCVTLLLCFLPHLTPVIPCDNIFFFASFKRFRLSRQRVDYVTLCDELQIELKFMIFCLRWKSWPTVVFFFLLCLETGKLVTQYFHAGFFSSSTMKRFFCHFKHIRKIICIVMPHFAYFYSCCLWLRAVDMRNGKTLMQYMYAHSTFFSQKKKNEWKHIRVCLFACTPQGEHTLSKHNKLNIKFFVFFSHRFHFDCLRYLPMCVPVSKSMGL